MRIWKFPIENGQAIQIPEGSEPLHVAEDPQGQVCIWALIDPEKELAARMVTVVGTGWDVPDAAQYIGTIHQGAYVWHIYLGEEE